MIDIKPAARITGVIAEGGDFVHPADTAAEAGAGHLSVEKGWGTETETPIEEGGVPPFRRDFNGVLNLFSQFLRFYQSGGVPEFDLYNDYIVGCEVRYKGNRWRCMEACGPNQGNTVVPGDHPELLGERFWKRLYDAHPGDGLPVGAIMPFKVQRLEQVDGDAASYPVFIGQSSPDTHWALCNGATTADGFATPDLVNKFIVAKNDVQTGSDGLTDTVSGIVTYGDHVPVGALLHTAAPLPAAVRGDRWYSCEGATLSKADFPEYAAMLNGRDDCWGITSGSGDTFAVPPLDGWYMQSVGEGKAWGHRDPQTLPNVVGAGLFWEAYSRPEVLSGAFFQSATKGHYGSNGGSDWDNYMVQLDASRCDATYGRDDGNGNRSRVQPDHANVLTYLHAKGPAAPTYAGAGTPGPTDAVAVSYFIKVKAYD